MHKEQGVQHVLVTEDVKSVLERAIRQKGIRKIFLVCDSSFSLLSIKNEIETLSVSAVVFSEVTPNPKIEEVVLAVEKFNSSGSDLILAVGGGSVMDVAKCIKHLSSTDRALWFNEESVKGTSVPLFAIPTTAGTGSEATHFSVVYRDGVKHSVGHLALIPDLAILAPSILTTLPLYQRRSTAFDALCQAIESYWSKRANSKSRQFSKLALAYLVENIEDYCNGVNTPLTLCNIFIGSYLSGCAINIAQTTIAHAMSYPITSYLGLSHGHAVALTLSPIWRRMASYGDTSVKETLTSLGCIIYGDSKDATADNGAEFIDRLLHKFDMFNAIDIDEALLCKLCNRVNSQRAKNTPLELSDLDIRDIYREALVRPSNSPYL